jgi:hypothetical protein
LIPMLRTRSSSEVPKKKKHGMEQKWKWILGLLDLMEHVDYLTYDGPLKKCGSIGIIIDKLIWWSIGKWWIKIKWIPLEL